MTVTTLEQSFTGADHGFLEGKQAYRDTGTMTGCPYGPGWRQDAYIAGWYEMDEWCLQAAAETPMAQRKRRRRASKVQHIPIMVGAPPLAA